MKPRYKFFWIIERCFGQSYLRLQVFDTALKASTFYPVISEYENT